MRALLLSLALVAVTIAGCVSEEDPEPEIEVPETPTVEVPEAPPVVTHPEYGFITKDDLLEGGPEHFPLPGQYSGNNPPGNPYVWRKPMFHDFGEFPTGIDFKTMTGNVSGGNGISVFGPIAAVGTSGGPMHVISIADPLSPVVVSKIDVPMRDSDIIAYPDGRLVVVSTGGGGQMYFTEITDPYNPVVIGQLQTPNNNHNIANVPGTPFVYNSPSDGGSSTGLPLVGVPQDPVGETDIITAEDPANPVLIRTWANGYGCHDVTFYMNAVEGKFRGYCAGIEALQIWDVTNVTEPTVISEWGWPSGGVHNAGAVSLASFAHLAIPNHDATILILGDESGGGIAPACDFSVHEPTTGTTATGPLGNLWFYDITDETTPVLKGSYSPSAHDQRGSCTAHFGRVVEDTNHVVMGFYSAGVVLVDFRDPQNPYEVAHYEKPAPVIGEGEGPGTVWDVWYYQGYLFTGDTSKGMDVLSLSGA